MNRGQGGFQKHGLRVAAVFAIVLPLVVPPIATTVSSAKAKNVNWKWSDGGTKVGRSLAKSTFGSAKRLPTINVTIRPRSIPRIATLQLWDDDGGTWVEEYRAQSVDGLAVLKLDPYCGGRAWCNGSIDYRIVIEPSGSQPTFASSEFSVTFINSASSGGSSSSSGSSSRSSNSGSSNSSSGVSAAAFIGWNLERVQDYLGFDPQTADCSGTGRSVWWASNWWVIGAYSGVLVVSKSRYGCS